LRGEGKRGRVYRGEKKWKEDKKKIGNEEEV
jgi:hypothetical protein